MKQRHTLYKLNKDVYFALNAIFAKDTSHKRIEQTKQLGSARHDVASFVLIWFGLAWLDFEQANGRMNIQTATILSLAPVLLLGDYIYQHATHELQIPKIGIHNRIEHVQICFFFFKKMHIDYFHRLLFAWFSFSWILTGVFMYCIYGCLSVFLESKQFQNRLYP